MRHLLPIYLTSFIEKVHLNPLVYIFTAILTVLRKIKCMIFKTIIIFIKNTCYFFNIDDFIVNFIILYNIYTHIVFRDNV